MIDNEHLGESGLAEVSLSRTVEAVRSGDHIQGLEQGRALMQGKAGSRLVLYGSEPEARTLGAMSGIGDCGRHDERSLSEVGIRAESLSVGSNIGVRLEARAHTACVSAPIKSFSKLSAYRVQFRYRTIRGSVCFCLLQEGLNECATMPPLSQKPGWHRYKEIAIPEIGAKGLQLFFYADGTLTGTSTEYRSIALTTSSLYVR